MQRNKYLDQLGIPIEDYGTNFGIDTVKYKKKWKKQRKKYGFDEREIWNMGNIFVEWLYSHLKMYKQIAGKYVDLSYSHFYFKGNEYTQKEAIDYIVKACEKYLLLDNPYVNNEKEIIEDMQDAIKLFAEIWQYMWW